MTVRPPPSAGQFESDLNPETSRWGTGLRLGMALASIVVGVIVLLLPVKTLLVVAVLFGIQLILLGVVRIVIATVAPPAPRWLKILSYVLGALTIVAGVICLLRPGTSLLLIAILLAAGWIADGVADLSRGITRRRSAGEVVLLVVSGLLSIVAGLVVVIFPGESLLLLAQFGGVALIVLGVIGLGLAVHARLRRRSP